MNTAQTAPRHALFWLVVANAVGVWLAALLLWPDLNLLFGSWTYGRWVPVHLNLQLYGWTSLPLIAWLFRVYEAHDSWAACAVWAWSGALLCGAVSWLMGRTTGKIFLDWTGGARVGFVAAMLVLWLILARGFQRQRKTLAARQIICRLVGLGLLLPVPFVLAWATSPKLYPPFDHTTGGPTGSSLLGSTLSVVVLLLLLPRAWPLPRRGSANWLWWLVAVETAIFLALEFRGGTHWQPAQVIGLALLLPWPALVWWDWRRFSWPERGGAWRWWMLLWWTALVVSGWLTYLPKVLDRLKFTDGLVAHAHLAMAGFTSALGLVILSLVGGPTAKAIDGTVPRRVWNFATLVFMAVLSVAGWQQGADLSWTTDPPPLRDWLYAARLACGLAMFLISARWWRLSLRESS